MGLSWHPAPQVSAFLHHPSVGKSVSSPPKVREMQDTACDGNALTLNAKNSPFSVKKRLESSQPAAVPCPGSCLTPSYSLEMLWSILGVSNLPGCSSNWLLSDLSAKWCGRKTPFFLAFCPPSSSAFSLHENKPVVSSELPKNMVNFAILRFDYRLTQSCGAFPTLVGWKRVFFEL